MKTLTIYLIKYPIMQVFVIIMSIPIIQVFFGNNVAYCERKLEFLIEIDFTLLNKVNAILRFLEANPEIILIPTLTTFVLPILVGYIFRVPVNVYIPRDDRAHSSFEEFVYFEEQLIMYSIMLLLLVLFVFYYHRTNKNFNK